IEDADSEVWSVALDGSDARNLTRSGATIDELWTGGWGPDGTILFGRALPGPADAGFLAREDLGAAAMLLSAGLLALVAVAVIQAGWTFGALTLVLSVAITLIVIPGEAWRFLVVGPVAGLAADLAVSRAPPRL